MGKRTLRIYHCLADLRQPLNYFTILFTLVISHIGVAQTPLNGDYRTRQSAAFWNHTDAWQVRSAGAWVNTTVPPTSANNVYVQNGHRISTTGGIVAVNNLHIHIGGVFETNGISQVYGKLRAYTGTLSITTGVDGSFYSSQASSAATPDGIIRLSVAANITFKGTTRTITTAGEWGPATLWAGIIFDLTPGSTATLQTPISGEGVTIKAGVTVNMGANCLYTTNAFHDITIETGATLISAASGSTTGNCAFASKAANQPCDELRLAGKLVLNGASPFLQFKGLILSPGSTIEYGGGVAQNFANASYAGTVVINEYRNLVLSGSGNKTPLANFSVRENISITGSSVLVMGSRTATVKGNWTSYGAAGLNEGTSTIDFDSSGAQTINSTGGENFYVLRKSALGTLTLNSNVNIVAGGNLNFSSGTIDANTNSFSGSATSAFNMSGGTLKLARLSTTLPEFSITSYNISGGTIELDGAGTQTLRGARDYRNLTFSNSGTKGITSAINNINGTITVANSVVLDVLNNTMGGAGTNLTMTGSSVYRTAGASQVKPDAAGTYSLGAGTTVEFNNSVAGLESIRFTAAATVNYNHVIVSGASVGTASLNTGIRFQAGGSFTVKNGGTFRMTNTTGFSGATTTAINNTNNPTIILDPGSTVEYNGDNQTISNQTINTPATANYDGLLLSGTGNKTAPAGNLSVKGNLGKAGTTTFVHNSGTVTLNGTTAQSYTATSPVMDFYNLAINNTVDVTISSDLSVSKALNLGANAKLNLTAGNITLRSTASNTANVGVIPSTAVITYPATGRFIVERYIPTGIAHGKSWQFLATPTNGGQTIRAAWQEGQAPLVPGTANRGTIITSNVTGAGFDIVAGVGASMKTFNPAGAGSWVGISNTTATDIYNQKGYMIFVRGDRTVSLITSPATVTTLRTTGKIAHPVSNIPPVTNVGNTQFESIGNPYASALDFSNDAGVVKSANMQKVFYVWDPKLGGAFGFGAYQTFTRGAGADNNYYVTPGGGSYGAPGSVNNTIQSGQAFLVHSFGGTGTISFNEVAKLNTSAVVFRKPVSHRSKQLRTNLYAMNTEGKVLVDGVLNEFDRSFSNGPDEWDALKIDNLSENIAISGFAGNLAVERRMEITAADTIFYRLSQLKIQQYQFQFIPVQIARAGLEAFLEDKFLNNKTAVSLNDTSHVSFQVTSDPRSYAVDRFRLVFRQKHKLPVSVEPDHPRPTIVVYPNPVIGNSIQLSFEGQPAGRYLLQLNSMGGQLVMENDLTAGPDRFITSLKIPGVAPGNYQLVITSSEGVKSTQQVIIQ